MESRICTTIGTDATGTSFQRFLWSCVCIFLTFALRNSALSGCLRALCSCMVSLFVWGMLSSIYVSRPVGFMYRFLLISWADKLSANVLFCCGPGLLSDFDHSGNRSYGFPYLDCCCSLMGVASASPSLFMPSVSSTWSTMSIVLCALCYLLIFSSIHW